MDKLVAVGAVGEDGNPRPIWLDSDGWSVRIIDQTRLPHELVVRNLRSLEDAAEAIMQMQVRGAPLIGATAAYGVALALRETDSGNGAPGDGAPGDGAPGDGVLDEAVEKLTATRPTAVNLRWALERMRDAVARKREKRERITAAYRLAGEICTEDVAINRDIGGHGLALIHQIAGSRPGGDPINIMTHCNAGWLATVGLGTATAPIYRAHAEGIPVHIWVGETRPRNQGAGLTAWELTQAGIPHTLIVDSAAGHLMQRGAVDLCLTGADRATTCGDVANKIGTYPKALAAQDNNVPFYVALPSPTIDWTIADGVRDIPIEERDAAEVIWVAGMTAEGDIAQVRVAPEESVAGNAAFDVTPARLVTGLITERGICDASREGLTALFPEQVQA